MFAFGIFETKRVNKKEKQIEIKKENSFFL